jgi:hypothetical protein
MKKLFEFKELRGYPLRVKDLQNILEFLRESRSAQLHDGATGLCFRIE